MTKKYILCPGYVHSRDGDRHWIGAERLAQLYHVPLSECVRIDPRYLERFQHLNDLLVLRPRSNGDYTLPKVEVKR